MQKLKFIFPLIGVAFIGLWFVKTISHVEAGSMKSMSAAVSKYQFLAFLGFACFWAYPTIHWFKSGSKVNSSKVITTLKEDIYPTYGRQIPGWAHGLRFMGFAGIIYFMFGAVRMVDDEIVFNFNYFFPSAFSAALFFLLPFVFQRKAQ